MFVTVPVGLVAELEVPSPLPPPVPLEVLPLDELERVPREDPFRQSLRWSRFLLSASGPDSRWLTPR